jgi:hypothetical protein
MMTIEKKPLFREAPQAEDFPAAALGPLRDPAEAIALATRAPLAICAQSALAAAALVVAPHYDVAMPYGAPRPVTGIFISIAESGERKTTVDRLALRAVHQHEERLRAAYEEKLHHFRADLEAWRAAQAKAKKGKTRAEIREALRQLGPEPKAPPHPMLLVSDPMPEALALHLQDGQPWCGVFSSEGGQIFGGVAFSDDVAERNAAMWNILWDGEAIRRARVGTGKTFLTGRRCAFHVMAQPVVAERLFGPLFAGIGLTARCLIVAPPTTAGTRFFRDVARDVAPILAEYDTRLTAFLEHPPRLKDDALDPIALPMVPAARAAWIGFYDEIERRIGPGADLAPIRAWGAKAAEHAARLAVVLAAYEAPDAVEIGHEAMSNAIRLTRFYGGEMLRLHGGAAVDPELALADTVLRWWHERSPELTLAQLYQTGPAAVRQAATARRCLAILKDHGHAEAVEGEGPERWRRL